MDILIFQNNIIHEVIKNIDIVSVVVIEEAERRDICVLK